jgi:Spy/CpxP family protein refolding chaperone
MKGSLALKLGLGFAGALLSGSVFAQAPDGGSGPGVASGPGFGEHRPPFERAMGGMGEHGHWWNNPKTIDRLKLTDTQRKAMDDTLQQHREGLVDLRGTLEKSELELEPMMKQDQPNESQIIAQIDKVAQARAELEKANARFLLAIRSKLTPEQWKQMQTDLANRPHGEWGHPDSSEQPRGAWQRHASPPPPDGQAPAPAGPQSMMDEVPGVDGQAVPTPSQPAME